MIIRKVAAHLPESLRYELRRLHHRRQIRRGTFISPEPEFSLLRELVQPGDWAIDVGANLGHYTVRLSDLVGPEGRVLAFEPIPTTFSLLAANVRGLPVQNVTLFNTAVSNGLTDVVMEVPKSLAGLENYYQAHIVEGNDRPRDALRVLTISLDCLNIQQRISLIKIDAEGHEDVVWSGMRKTVERHQPMLIVENPSAAFQKNLEVLGYQQRRLTKSPNVMFSK